MTLLDEWRRERAIRQQQARERSLQVASKLKALQKQREARALQQQSALNEFRACLARNMAEFLANTKAQRQSQAQQQAKQLDEWARSLAEEIAQFLALTSSQRAIESAQLAKKLHEFRANLSATVAALRESNRDSQAEEFAKLNKELATFVEELGSEVQKYLQELHLRHLGRSRILRQSLRQNRLERQAAMQALFDRLGRFRGYLLAYHSNLHWSVWGALREQAAPNAAPSGADAQNSEPAKPEPKAAASPPNPLSDEQKVYDYIRLRKGVRLQEIETALSINRIQAVDALRNLIEKGLIADSDRTYIILQATAATITNSKI